MWIFGYGSLVWKADFPYINKVVGYVKGYERRFWQASIDHRGTPEKPGRVVTLIPSTDPEAKVWGVCYEISATSEEAASHLKALDTREQRFEKTFLKFYAKETDCPSNHYKLTQADTKEVECLVYIANTSGPLFLGDASSEDMAHQIATAEGPSGRNSEYLFRLADFMRTHVPVCVDTHLFDLEKHVRDVMLHSSNGVETRSETKDGCDTRVWGVAYKIDSSNVSTVLEQLDLREVMGYEKVPIHFHPILEHPHNSISSVAVCEDDNENILNYEKTPFLVTMYYGNPQNEHFVGPAPLDEIARQIWTCAGPSGKNIDYLYKLADAMRMICDEALDEHLSELEQKVRQLDNVIVSNSTTT